MDAVALGSIAAVVVTIIIFVVLSFRLKRLMDSTHSEEDKD